MSAVVEREQAQQVSVTTHHQVLADAIARCSEAERELAEAKHARAQAQDAAAAAEQDLARFADLDQRIGAARAALVKKGKTGRLPDHLIAEREQRRVARELVEETNSALALLTSEQANAEQHLRMASAARSAAALQLLLDQAAALSAELRAAKEQAWELEDQLRGIDFVVTGTVPTLPREVRGTLMQQLSGLFEPLHMQRPDYPPASPANPVRLEAARWRKRHAELIDSAADAGTRT